MKEKSSSNTIRLNKFISNTGFYSRREADKLIAKGRVTVNGSLCTKLGIKINLNDSVKVDGKVFEPKRKVYILLNKPKDFCTNTNINKNKKSARELIKNIKQEIVSVGNLSYQTTGLVFYTNDLELKEKLLSPTNQVKEIYSLVLNKNISEDDIKKIKECTNINNTIVRINKVERLNNKNEFGLETYMCDDDILKIIFEKINIKIIKLDRVLFGPFTKKDLPRGKWRMLNKIEVRNLKLL